MEKFALLYEKNWYNRRQFFHEQDFYDTNFCRSKRKTVETAEFTEDGRYKRKVRSFVLRTGRLSEFQRNMMNDNWGTLGLDYQTEPFDFAKIYGNDNPVVLEIGFGMGKSLVDMAFANPDKITLALKFILLALVLVLLMQWKRRNEFTRDLS